MVRFSQTSWFNRDKESVLNLMRYAPLRMEMDSLPLLYYFFPQGPFQGASVSYRMIFDFQQVAWEGIIGSIQADEIIVRQNKGPFRGFDAKHSFSESEGVLTCRDFFSFQGEDPHFKTILKDARLCYAITSREKAAAVTLHFETQQKTKQFEVLDSGLTG